MKGRWQSEKVHAVDRGEDSRITESDHVGPTVAGDVGEQSKVTLDPPAAGVKAEILQHHPRRMEAAVAAVERNEQPGIGEADDVGAAIAGEIGE